MKHSGTTVVVIALSLGAQAHASELELRVESGGSSSIMATGGASVSFEIVGELSDNLNEGLALFVVDLTFDGGDLTTADAPIALPMLSFAQPDGFANPGGFGGTVQSGDLLQVGGGQNTINNSVSAPFPVGSVITGVAANGAPEVLVGGSFTAPLQAGTYTLAISNPRASIIRQGETGVPFWTVDAIDVTPTTELTVTVSCAPAAVVNRNPGLNPNSYAATAPVLGGVLTATVDLNTTGHANAVIFAFDSPFSLFLGNGQELLCLDLSGGGELFTGSGVFSSGGAGGILNYSLAVPNDPNLCGFALCSQAIHFGSVVPFALSNAQDMTVGT